MDSLVLASCSFFSPVFDLYPTPGLGFHFSNSVPRAQNNFAFLGLNMTPSCIFLNDSFIILHRIQLFSRSLTLSGFCSNKHLPEINIKYFEVWKVDYNYKHVKHIACKRVISHQPIVKNIIAFYRYGSTDLLIIHF